MIHEPKRFVDERLQLSDLAFLQVTMWCFVPRVAEGLKA